MKKRNLYFLVSNSLHQDQRLHRIATTLVSNNYGVTILAINNTDRDDYVNKEFNSESTSTWFKSGFLFYLELNFRFFFKLLFLKNYVGVVANDIDTALAAKFASLIRGKALVVDLHEYYTEAPEVRDRPFIKAVWSLVSKFTLPSSKHNYTVNDSLANLFTQKYKQEYIPIYNFPSYKVGSILERENMQRLKLVYVGAVNNGRGMIPLLFSLIEIDNVSLTIIGEGDEMQEVVDYVNTNNLHDKVDIKGFVEASKLHDEIQKYDVGLNLLDASSKSYYYSSANKYFDYTMAGLPCISMAFPEYLAFNKKYETAVLIPNLSKAEICKAIIELRDDNGSYNKLHSNCIKAKEKYNWNSQSEKLIAFYDEIFSP